MVKRFNKKRRLFICHLEETIIRFKCLLIIEEEGERKKGRNKKKNNNNKKKRKYLNGGKHIRMLGGGSPVHW